MVVFCSLFGHSESPKPDEHQENQRGNKAEADNPVGRFRVGNKIDVMLSVSGGFGVGNYM